MVLKTSQVCKVLSVETRLNIIKLLKTKGPMGAQDLAANLGVSTAAISQHLKILSQAGIVTGERKGFCIPYAVDEEVLGQCRKILAEACLCGCAESMLAPNKDSADLKELCRFERQLEEQLKVIRERIKSIKQHE